MLFMFSIYVQYFYFKWKSLGMPVPQEVQEAQSRAEEYHNPHHPSDGGHSAPEKGGYLCLKHKMNKIKYKVWSVTNWFQIMITE